MTAVPAALAYNDLAGIDNYAHPGALVIVDSTLIDDPKVKGLVDAGGEAAIYVNVMEAPDSYSGGERASLYEGAPIKTAWQWSPKRSNFGGSTMTDVRQGSAWWAHVLAWFGPMLDRHPHVRRVFLDVYGERLWSGAWDAMDATERAGWTAGMRWAIPQLHAIAKQHGVVLTVNGTWALGQPDAEGACIENHDFSEAGYWRDYMAHPWAASDHIVITRSSAQALQWAQVAGVRWVAIDQSNYARVGPVWGDFLPDPTPAPRPLQKPVPPAFTADAQPDGTIRLVVTPLPPETQVGEYQLYGITAQNEPGKNHKIVPAGVSVISGLTPDVTLTLRMSASNPAGYGDWAPVAGLPVTPYAEPAPPPSPDPCADLRSQLATAITERDQAIAERDAARAIGLGLMDRIDAAKAALG